MDELQRLAELVRKRNAVEREIGAIIHRPAINSHIGEYIAATVFHVALNTAANSKSFEGTFSDGPLAGKSVEVKCYGRLEELLDMQPDGQPDFYLVMTGPAGTAATARGVSRPFTIAQVFLFEGPTLSRFLQQRAEPAGADKVVGAEFWKTAEIYPEQRNTLLELSSEQRNQLQLFL